MQELITDNTDSCLGSIKLIEQKGAPMERTKVVARYLSGKLTKGYTLDFFANKDRFHVTPIDEAVSAPIEVVVNQLKGVFLVRDFNGNPQYTERKGYIEGQNPYGTLIEVTFLDGEILVGSSVGFDLKRQGFFISPVDPKSNNVRVFVVRSALKRIRQLVLRSGEYVEVPVSGEKGASC